MAYYKSARYIDGKTSRDIEDNCKDIDQITSIADRLILELFNHYKAEENQKDVIFDAHLSIIIRFLKLCRNLRETKVKR